MNIIVNGSTGVMGRHLIELIEASAEHSVCAKVSRSSPTCSSFDQYSGPADCVIDFSNHAATADLLAYCLQRKLPLVIATTGHSPEEKEAIRHAAETVPVFFSGNMSLGIAVLVQLAKQAAKMFPDADIEIVEKHHNRKLDVPSGTALMLADAIKEVRPEATYNIGRPEGGKRTKNEIGIHALRYGNEVGTHEVIIATPNQVLTLKHESETRALFAEGALSAAVFTAKQCAGLYSMAELLADSSI